jgi:drug/metabolite transporter (DMT)-like permease
MPLPSPEALPWLAASVTCSLLASHPGIATLGAAAAAISYLTILWVYTRTQIAIGAALRDTSIVFAALIATVVLRERMTPARVGAVALVAAGAVTLRLA